MARSNQGGSILSFLIIGGVLAVLLIGGAYFVQQQSARSIADKNKTPVATQPAAQSNESADKKNTPATENKKVAVEPNKEGAAPKTAPQPTTPPATQLPKTGPAEMVSSLLGAGLLSGMIVAYVRSRRLSVTL
jgi:LPXTG-motif cell wall-anchored protein